MNCFPCFKKSQEKKDEEISTINVPVAQPKFVRLSTPQPAREHQNNDANTIDSSNIEAKNFTFRELATATKNFRRECLLGEFGFGRIYKGTLQPTGEVVYVKRLDKNSLHGNKEFLVEVLMLSLLHHPNLLDLVGYCADGDQRLLVYEYMPMGSVDGHLLDMESEKIPLDWRTRMKIAFGIAQGLEYLHETAKPPIIYRDLKCSNIMLDDEFNPKLSDHGLAKLGGNNKSQVTAMGDYGYHAPEYEKLGELTLKSDVYNFGVVLLELITGRRAVDTTKPSDEQNLVKWAQPIFRDPKRFPEMADPRLNGFPVKSLNQVVGVAAMCLQDEPDVRPLIGDVVATLSFLSLAPPDEPAQASPPESKDAHVPVPPPEINAPSRKESRRDNTDYSEESSESSWSDYEESLDQNHNEEKYDCMDDEKRGSDHESYSSEISYSSLDDEEKEQQQEKENIISSSDNEVKEQQQEKENFISSWGHMDSLEFEVASMSSSSSNNDNESRLPSINKRSTNNKSKSHHVRSSLKWKSRSTKTTKRHQEERHEGIITSTSRQSYQIKSARLSSKGRNLCDVEKNKSARLSSKGRNGHESEKNQSAYLSLKSRNGHDREKSQSVREKSQSVRLSSKGRNGHGKNGVESEKNPTNRLSSKGRNGREYEKNQIDRLSSKDGNGHKYEKNRSDRLSSKGKNGREYEKNQSARLSSKGKSGRENEKNQSMCSYSRESSIAGSNDESARSGHHSDNDEFEEESLL